MKDPAFIDSRIKDLEAVTQRLETEFSSLSADAADIKPDADSWSVNECLDHIQVSNSRYHSIFTALENGGLPPNGWARIPFWSSLMGAMILSSVRPTTARKTKTFPVFLPSKSHYGRNVLPDLVAANRKLAALFAKLKDVDLDATIVTSPVNRFVVYSLRTCVDILVEHEKRHANQAARVRAGLQGPRGGPVG